MVSLLLLLLCASWHFSYAQKPSKLWVVNPDAGATDRWIGYSLRDLAANPELAKKATPVWAGPEVDPNLSA